MTENPRPACLPGNVEAFNEANRVGSRSNPSPRVELSCGTFGTQCSRLPVKQSVCLSVRPFVERIVSFLYYLICILISVLTCIYSVSVKALGVSPLYLIKYLSKFFGDTSDLMSIDRYMFLRSPMYIVSDFVNFMCLCVEFLSEFPLEVRSRFSLYSKPIILFLYSALFFVLVHFGSSPDYYWNELAYMPFNSTFCKFDGRERSSLFLLVSLLLFLFPICMLLRVSDYPLSIYYVFLPLSKPVSLLYFIVGGYFSSLTMGILVQLGPFLWLNLDSSFVLVWIVVFEEIHKAYFPFVLPLVELNEKIQSGFYYFPAFVAFSMHFLLSFLPLKWRFVFHYSFNLRVTHFMLSSHLGGRDTDFEFPVVMYNLLCLFLFVFAVRACYTDFVTSFRTVVRRSRADWLPRPRRWFVSAGFGKNKSKFKVRDTTKLLKVINFDPAYNDSLYVKDSYVSSSEPLRRLKGKTVFTFQGEVLSTDYPVFQLETFMSHVKHCPTKNSLLPYLSRTTIPYPTLRSFIVRFGALTSAAFITSDDVGDAVFSNKYYSTYFDSSFHEWYREERLTLLFFLSFLALLPYLSVIPWLYLGVCLSNEVSIHNADLVFTKENYLGQFAKIAIFEELVKDMNPFFLPLEELRHRIIKKGHHPTYYLTFFLHFFFWYFGPLGVIIHFVWNVFAYHMEGEACFAVFGLDMLTDKQIEQGKTRLKMLTLAEHLYKKEIRQFLTQMAVYGYLEKFADFLKSESKDLETFIGLFFLNAESNVTPTNPSVLGVFSRFLPRAISQSPVYSAVVSVISIVFSSFFFPSYKHLVAFLPLLDFTRLTAVEVAATALESCSVLFFALREAYRDNSFINFFKDPHLYVLRTRVARCLAVVVDDEATQAQLVITCDALFEECARSSDMPLQAAMEKLEKKKMEYVLKKKVTDILVRINKAVIRTCVTAEEYAENLKEVNALIAEETSVNHPQMLKRLEERATWLRKFLSGIKKRRPPLTFILLGSPGGGKTAVMRMLARFYYAKKGEVLDDMKIGSLNFEDKYPATGVPDGATVLIANDVTADHSQDAKTDKVPLGVIIQMVLDTEPLFFKAPDIPSKGKTFFPDLFFITSNASSFTTSEDATRLKRRFDEHAIVLSLEVYDEKTNRPVPFSEYDLWDVERRNRQTKVQLLEVTTNDKSFSFIQPKSKEPHHISYLYQYLDERLDSMPKRWSQREKLFSDVCTCGVINHVHFPVEDGPFVPLSNLCTPSEKSELVRVDPLCSCGLYPGHRENPLIEHLSEVELKRKLNNKAQLSAGGSRVYLTSAPPLEVGTFNLMYYYFWAMIVSYVVWNIVAQFTLFMDETRNRRDILFVKVLNVCDSVDAVVNLPQRSSRKAYKYYLRGRVFVRENAPYFALSGVAILALVAAWRKETTHETAKIITRENIDPNSLIVDSYTQEVNYSPEVAKEWNKEQKLIKNVKLVTERVAPTDLLSILNSSVVTYWMVRSDATIPVHFLILNPSWVMTSAHYFFKEGIFLPSGVTFEGRSALIGECDVVILEHDGKPTDVVIVRNPFPTMNRDIVKYFSDDISVSQININVFKSIDSSSHNALIGLLPRVGDPNEHLFRAKTWNSRKKAPNGECGLPAVASTSSGGFILGIVSYRIDDIIGETQGGNIITRRDILEGFRIHPEPYANALTSNVALTCLQPSDVRSEFRNNPTPFLELIGSNGAKGAKFASSFKPTHLEAFIRESGFLSKPYGIIRKTHGLELDSSGEKKYVSAFGQTMKGIVPDGIINSDELRESGDQYVDYVVKGVHEAMGNIQLSPLSLADSFLGDPQQDVPRCNFESSVGPEDRFYKSRSGIFDEIDGKMVANPLFVEKIRQYLIDLKQNVARAPWVCGAYKDEIRSQEKLDAFRVRLFYTVDLSANTVSRMYLMPLIQVLLRFPKLSKCYGKLNSGSVEWDDLFKYLTQGERLMDLDFANFDMSHFQRVIREVAWVFYKLAMVWYKHEESARICYFLVLALCVQVFEHKGDFALKYKGLPSGHIVTLILNSIVNVLLMMCAFKRLCPGENFFEEVFPATVGDDNASGLSAKVCARFNLVTLQPIYRAMGYTVTAADKSEVAVPFIDEDKMQFVKRKFRYEPELGLRVAPLELDSIYKMLSFWTFKNEVGCSYSERMSACVDVAQREFFLHGRASFDGFVKTFRPEIDKYGWAIYWYSYDELRIKYLSGESFMQW